ncbi:protein EFR3, partial [Tremellales sp. Uapishka_1]
MGCFPCQSLQPEVALLNACYPPSKQLLSTAPDYRPLSQDLSKLTYYATNKPSKIAKIGEELEKRVHKEAMRSTGGYPKYRASLLISLAVLKALISECKRDLGLFSRSIIRIIDSALSVKIYQKDELDLEVAGRASSCFTAFTTFSDGAPVGVDDSLTVSYMNVLKKFSAMAVYSAMSEKPDSDLETRNRTRLIALAAIHGASSSDAMFSSNSEFPRQINIIVPPLLQNLFGAPIAQLKLETAKIEMDASPSPFFTEFSARPPLNDRRAPSLHAHVTGEKGPTANDVVSAALRTLQALISQCQINQASHVLEAVFDYLNKVSWSDVERCCWLAERLTAFMLLQYRFVVPTRLVEMIVDLGDDLPPSPRHSSALAMVTTILNSSVSLVGLAVSDLLSNLVTLIIRRIRLDQRDVLLPPLVQCIASLGTHVYYADQINDIVEELAQRIAEIHHSEKARPEIVRVLINCITGVMSAADVADEAENRAISPAPESHEKGKAPQVGTPLDVPRRESGRRNPVAPEVWQETLPLLCEADFAVRAAYARALLLFLENEVPRARKPLKPTDVTLYRFCNALHAAIYTLAMSSCLGAEISEPSIASNQPSPQVVSLPTVSQPLPPTASGEKVTFTVKEPTPSATPRESGTSTPPRKPVRTSRRVSLPLNRLNSSAGPLGSFDNVATPLDFAAILQILDELHTVAPVAALTTGVSMLLALDRDAGTELIRRPNDGRAGAWVLERKRACRETVALMWRRLGEQWGIRSIEDLADKGLSTLPEPFLVPSPAPPPQPSILPQPEEPFSFPPNQIEGESSATSLPLLDPEILVSALVTSPSVLEKTGRDASTLVRRFAGRWTVEIALKDSVERFSSAEVRPQDNHFDVAHVLLGMDNPSYQSFFRPNSNARSIDVGDLREALGNGRNDGMNSGPPSIISTTNGTAADDYGTKKKFSHDKDVKEVLKDIFKDKKRRKANGPAAVSVVA